MKDINETKQAASAPQKAAVTAAIAGILSLGMATTAQAVPNQPTAWEKCAGVSKAGKNDCGSFDGKHHCHSQSTADNLSTEWIYVPQGTCEKITGGVVKKVKPAKTAEQNKKPFSWSDEYGS